MLARASAAIETMPPELADLPQTRIPSCHAARWGWMPCARWHTRNSEAPTSTVMPKTALPPSLRGLVEDIAASGHGVIMTMGKGGVGKTTVAAAIAVALAKKATRWCSPPPTRPPTPQRH
jgi:arsenite-transporting ATPase